MSSGESLVLLIGTAIAQLHRGSCNCPFAGAMDGRTVRSGINSSLPSAWLMPVQWRRDGVCRPGQTSVLLPPPIRSVIRSGYFSGFRTWGVNQPLASPLFFPFPSRPSISHHFLPSLSRRPFKKATKFQHSIFSPLQMPLPAAARGACLPSPPPLPGATVPVSCYFEACQTLLFVGLIDTCKQRCKMFCPLIEVTTCLQPYACVL